MANYGTTTHRPSPNSSSQPPSQDNETKNASPQKIYTFTFSFPFNIPSTPESAAARIIKNLEKFSLYYSIFVWTVLFIALVPRRKNSVIYLVAMTEMTFLYFLLLRAFPGSTVLHKIIDKRLVLFVLFVITAFELILTEAALHLFVVLAATLPFVMVHALLTKRDDLIGCEGDREIAQLVQENLGDDVSHGSEDMV